MPETSTDEVVLNLSSEDLHELAKNYAKDLHKTEKKLNDVILELENQRVTNQMLINKIQKYNQIIQNLKVQNDLARVRSMVSGVKNGISNVIRFNLAVVLFIGIYYKDKFCELFWDLTNLKTS